MAYLEMLRFTDLAHPGRKRWCTAIVLIAICALTVSVATRYGSPVASDAKVSVLQSQSSWEPGIQRLLNNAASWIPARHHFRIAAGSGLFPARCAIPPDFPQCFAGK